MRRKLLFLLACFVLTGSAFAQNTFSVITKAVKPSGTKPIVIQRNLTCPHSQLSLARHVCVDVNHGKILSVHSQNLRVRDIVIPQYHIKAKIAVGRLNRPENLHGGYNYLRTLAKQARELGTIEPCYAQIWKKIADSRTYNGAHHIVNKSTLKEIHKDMKQKAEERGLPFPISLTEMQNNAPAVFHRLHGTPEYKHIFHNNERQVGLYYTGGMKMVIEDFFYQLKELGFRQHSRELQIPPAVQEATLAEAELWCKMFHLRWE